MFLLRQSCFYIDEMPAPANNAPSGLIGDPSVEASIPILFLPGLERRLYGGRAKERIGRCSTARVVGRLLEFGSDSQCAVGSHRTRRFHYRSSVWFQSILKGSGCMGGLATKFAAMLGSRVMVQRATHSGEDCSMFHCGCRSFAESKPDPTSETSWIQPYLTTPGGPLSSKLEERSFLEIDV